MLNRELGPYTIVAPLGAGGPASARVNALASSGEVSPQPSEGDAMNSGDEVGPYRVLGKLGEGGMGEVYRARDSKLGRDVAIKILPSHFTADPERRARFEREARLLATLNHPMRPASASARMRERARS
jgi:serine/threonine protein kinase